MEGVRDLSKGVVAISGSELRALFDKEPHLGYKVIAGLVRVIGTRMRNIEHLLITGKMAPATDKQRTG